MAQATYTVGSGQSGTAYRTADNNGKEALATTHKGSSQPSYRAAGMIWCDDSANPLWTYKAYDGTDWTSLGTLNTSTNVWQPANAALQDGSNTYAADAGATDSYAITLSPAIAAYAIGMTFRFKANTANTGAATLNINGVGAVALKKNYNQTLQTGDILANQIVEVIYDGTNFQVLSVGGFIAQRRLIDMGIPLYASATTFTVSSFSLYDSLLTTLIEKSGSTTLDITTYGANGITQSAALTGTVGTGGSPSTTITGVGTTFTTQFQVGDIIYTASGAARITAIGSNTSLTVANALTIANGTAFKRGGRANASFYYLYASTDSSTPALFLSTRNVAGGSTLDDLPAGYSTYRQLPFFILTDSSANMLNFTVCEGWPVRPKIKYNVYFPGACVPATTQVLALGTSASFTTLSLSTLVPPISRQVWLHTAYQNGNTSSAAQIRPNGTAHNGYEQYPMPGSLQATRLFPMETDASQQVQYAQAALGNFYVYVHSVIVTEVA